MKIKHLTVDVSNTFASSITARSLHEYLDKNLLRRIRASTLATLLTLTTFAVTGTTAQAATYTTDIVNSALTIAQTHKLKGFGKLLSTDSEYKNYTVSRFYKLQSFDQSLGTLTGARLNWNYNINVSAFTEFRKVFCEDGSFSSSRRDCRDVDVRNNAGKGDKDPASAKLSLSVLGADGKRTLGTPQVFQDGEYSFNPTEKSIGGIVNPTFRWGDFTSWPSVGTQILSDLDQLLRFDEVDLTLTAQLFDSGGWIDCDPSVGTIIRGCSAEVLTRLFWDIDFESEYEYTEFVDDDDDDLSAVPLPATGWMLLAGLGVMFRRRRTHA